MKFLAAFCILFTTIVVISCSKKNSPGKAVVPKTSYAANVQSIVQAKCSPCHIPSAGGKKLALDSYTAVKTNIDSIIKRIELAPHEKGFMPMRKDPLPATEIAVFKKWKEDGTVE